ncbi:unnamed protein product [Spirodela intermedia]|uniref:Homeobox domain-containing protein n=1 Tax=Spirodela intermedia TaxID=51605 RepID=A0A7I8K270_SPIIN|nr:unnamed protein product [Spirodela intermedia]
MEESEGKEKGPSVAAAPPPQACSRWNPTKEQISLLEGLYRQGVRTPTAEQIQHIAGKLQEFGRIEGKNVFYWFQNHKARQRQKQKQENFGHLSRLLRTRAGPPPLRPAPPHPTLHHPPPAGGTLLCYHPPLPAVVFAGAMAPEGAEETRYRNLERYDRRRLLETAAADEECMCDAESRQTLQLFPLHPAGASKEEPVDSPPSTESDDGGSCCRSPSPLDFFGSQYGLTSER